MNRETFDEIMAMATALLVGYWMVQTTSYIWDIFLLVCKTLVSNAILPE